MEFFEHRPDTNRTIAALFRQCVVAPGFEQVTAEDVGRMHPYARHVLIRAIHEATAPEDASDADDGQETTHADRIHSLHELEYTFPDLYGLLPREIELAAEGARRAKERRDENSADPSTDPVESAEGTTIRGGPADGAEKIDFVDQNGDVLTN